MDMADVREKLRRCRALAEQRTAEAPPDPDQERRVREGYLARVGFGPRYWHADWDQVREPLRSALRAYCEDLPHRLSVGDGMIIGGGLGVGKSQALSLVALAAREVAFIPADSPLPRRPVVVYLSATTLYEAWFEHRDEPGEDARRADLLLWDDFDRVHLSDRGGDWLAHRIEALAEERYAWRRSTVVTINSAAKFDDPRLARTVDRWREVMIDVTVKGESRRAR